MLYYKILGDTLQAIANAIRTKSGTTEQILPSDMPAKINAIETVVTYDGSVIVV